MTPASVPAPTKFEAALAGLPTTRRYLVGVSGGRDSVALLHLLWERGYRKLIVCHLDHGLRGRASREDARFVQRLATKLGLEAFLARADVRARSEQTRCSIETAAREARLEFFAEAARRYRCQTLFLAHHADDRVETFLFNLFRGSGMAGLGAIRADSRLGTLRIVRPLLGVWRAEIDAYVAANRLRFREDATNLDLGPRRNTLRHQIIPELEERFGRPIRASLWRNAEILEAENAWMESLVPSVGPELSVPELRSFPLALQRRTIQRWLKEAKVPGIGFEAVEAVRSLLAEPAGCAKVNLPGNRHARRRAKKLFLDGK